MAGQTLTNSEAGNGRLEIRNLRVTFPIRNGIVEAVRSVSMTVEENEIVGVVGETGSGKSVSAAAVLGLLPSPGRVESGQIIFEGQDLRVVSEQELNRIRGGAIAFIPQHARAALHPMLPIGDQMLRIRRAHEAKFRRDDERERVLDAMRSVHLPDPEQLLRAYPHQLSGGMAQRVVIAIAFLARPHLLIADEPTSGLDATVQLRVLRLLHRMIKDAGTSALIITHDLGVVANFANSVVVMHAGRVVEAGPVEDVFEHPRHPYTIGLLSALPSSSIRSGDFSIKGSPPDPTTTVPGCSYAGRCPIVDERCTRDDPALELIDGKLRYVSCHHVARVEAKLEGVFATAAGTRNPTLSEEGSLHERRRAAP